MNRKSKEGITLIALVITIIVLLILAGISISMLSGENSILNQAGRARDITGQKDIEERIELAYLGASIKGKGDVKRADLLVELQNQIGNEIQDENVIGSHFTFTVTFNNKKYEIENNGNVHEVNNNIVTMAELQENASTYFGYDVINYAETLPNNLQDTKWQLFYAGTLEGETEQRIYLISKEFVKNSVLPAINGKTPVAVEGSNYKAFFDSGTGDGINGQYSAYPNPEIHRKYNKKYYLNYPDVSLRNTVRQSVTYMLDTTIWDSFASSSKGYAELAFGGPTIELLFTAYNKYAGTLYETTVENKRGYKIRTLSTENFSDVAVGVISSNNCYSISSFSDQASAYWIASPCDSTSVSMLFNITENESIAPTQHGYQEARIPPNCSSKFELSTRKNKRFKQQ